MILRDTEAVSTGSACSMTPGCPLHFGVLPAFLIRGRKERIARQRSAASEPADVEPGSQWRPPTGISTRVEDRREC